jgi:uncharacterized repeat protein (TIGR01451 family)
VRASINQADSIDHNPMCSHVSEAHMRRRPPKLTMTRDRAESGRAQVRARFQLEDLEERRLLSTFNVTSDADDGSSGTLRWAINQVLNDPNPSPGGDTIGFQIGGVGESHTITLDSALPVITKPVVIAGWSQGGPLYQGAPLIEIDGGNLAATDSVLMLSGGSSTVAGLVIDNCPGYGITLSTNGGDRVIGSYIGTDATGKAAKPNLSGIYISGSSSNTIGGASAADRNIISGNTDQGIIIGDVGVADHNLVIGNYIGVDVTGQAPLPNGNGILVDHTQGTTIGGTLAGTGNVISGNGQEGIIVDAADGENDGTQIAGNLIGLAADGTTPVPNAKDGVASFGIGSIFVTSPGPKGNTDGDSSTTHTRVGPGNAISGNGRYGVFLDRGVGNNSLSSDWIEGNSITGNADVGVNLFASSGNTIGGTSAAERNVISGNGGTGINIDSPFVAVQNLIEGNFVGTDSTGTKAYPNYGDGISLWNTQNTVGGTAAGAGNLISGNSFNGIVVNGDHMVIQGNRIGTDSTGTGSIPNQLDGIHLSSGNNLIGGTAAGAGNVIANNQGAGVFVESTFDHDGILSNSIYGNSNLGINLGAVDEPMTNTPGTAAGNDNQFYPVLTDASTNGLTSTITGHLTGVPNASYLVQLFESPTADPSGFGQGKIYLGQVAIGTGDSGIGSFVTSDLAAITPGYAISATATDASNNTSEFSEDIEAVGYGDVGLTMQASPEPVLVGGTLTYTITVTNRGGLALHGVVVTDPLPSAVTYGSASTDTGAVSRSGQTVTAQLGTLAAGQVATITIHVSPNTSAAPSIANTATVSISSDDVDTNSSDDSQTVTTTVDPSADLSVSLAADSPSVHVGVEQTYSMTVRNNGPSGVDGVVAVDTLPAGVTFDAIRSSAGLVYDSAARTVTANVGHLDNSAAKLFSIAIVPTAGAIGTIIDSATVSEDPAIADVVPSNNGATVSSTVLAALADLGVGLSAAGSVDAGADLTETINITNAGPSPATGVVVTDTLPDNVEFVSAGPLPYLRNDRNQIVFQVGAMAAGDTAALTIVVRPTAAAGGTSLHDEVTIAGSEADADTGNDKATLDTPVSKTDDLSVSFAATPDPVRINTPLTYTIKVTNIGLDASTDSALTVPLSPDVSFASATADNGAWVGPSGGAIGGDLGAISPGATVTVRIIVIPRRAAIGTLTASATVGSAVHDVDPTNNGGDARATVLDVPGSLQFGAASYEVSETAGSAWITVVRADGELGTISVGYSVSPIVATPGLDYSPVSGTLTFGPGVTWQSFSVPILADPHDNHDETVSLVLSDPTGGASLGSPATSTLTIRDVDPDTTPPLIRSFERVDGAAGSSLTLGFSEPLAPAQARDANNYHLYQTGRTGIMGAAGTAEIGLASVAYDPATGTAILVTATPLRPNKFYYLDVIGQGAGAIRDLGGNPLAGDGSHAGTDYGIYFAAGNRLKYNDADGDKVTLRIKKGGMIEDERTSSGRGERLTILGEVPRRTVLTGTVKRARGGDGRVYLGPTVYGLGNFGDVKVKMTSPPFSVDDYPLSHGRGRGAAATAKAAHEARAARPSTIPTGRRHEPSHAHPSARLGARHPRARPFHKIPLR